MNRGSANFDFLSYAPPRTAIQPIAPAIKHTVPAAAKSVSIH